MSLRAPNDIDFPSLHAAAEATSAEAQGLFKRLTSGRLIALTGAGGLGVWATTGDPARWLGAAAALLFVAALLLEIWLLRSTAERRWYEARAAAESAKTLGWRYAVCGEPFGRDAKARPDDVLHQQLKSVLDVLKNIELAPEIGPGRTITDWMKQVRSASLQERKDVYEKFRVADQQSWYARRAKDHKADLDRWTRCLFAAEALGLIGAVIQIAGAWQLNLLGFSAALAAGVAAWIQTNRYRDLHSAYTVTALELSSLFDKVQRPETEDEWAQFVEESEKAFSREHTLWKASRGTQSL